MIIESLDPIWLLPDLFRMNHFEWRQLSQFWICRRFGSINRCCNRRPSIWQSLEIIVCTTNPNWHLESQLLILILSFAHFMRMIVSILKRNNSDSLIAQEEHIPIGDFK